MSKKDKALKDVKKAVEERETATPKVKRETRDKQIFENQSKNYDDKERKKEYAPSIDRQPWKSSKRDKDEEAINKAADERIAQEKAEGKTPVRSVEKSGQTSFLPKHTAKEDLENAAGVLNVKVELVLKTTRGKEKAITTPLINWGMPSSEVVELCILAFKSRRNLRRIAAALDLPEDHPYHNEAEELRDSNPLTRITPEASTIEPAKTEETTEAKTNEDIDPATVQPIGVASGFGVSLPQGEPEKEVTEEVKPVKKVKRPKGEITITQQGEVTETEESFIDDNDGGMF